MRRKATAHIVFFSTGSTYGESPVIPTPDNAPFPVQTYLYGASKLAGEGLISAYCEALSQKKSALCVKDCAEAIMVALERCGGKVNFFNLGTNEYVQANDSVRIITHELGVSPPSRTWEARSDGSETTTSFS